MILGQNCVIAKDIKRCAHCRFVCCQTLILCYGLMPWPNTVRTKDWLSAKVWMLVSFLWTYKTVWPNVLINRRPLRYESLVFVLIIANICHKIINMHYSILLTKEIIFLNEIIIMKLMILTRRKVCGIITNLLDTVISQ